MASPSCALRWPRASRCSELRAWARCAPPSLQSEGMIGVGEIFSRLSRRQAHRRCRRGAAARRRRARFSAADGSAGEPRARRAQNSSARRRHVGSSKKRAPRITRGGSGQEICSPRISKRKTRASVSKRRARGSSRKRRRRLRGRSPNRHTCGGDDWPTPCPDCAGENCSARPMPRRSPTRERAGACWQFGRGGWAWFPSPRAWPRALKKIPTPGNCRRSAVRLRKTSRSSSRCSPRRSAGCTTAPAGGGLAEEAMLRGRWQKPPSPEGGEGQGEVPTRAQTTDPCRTAVLLRRRASCPSSTDLFALYAARVALV